MSGRWRTVASSGPAASLGAAAAAVAIAGLVLLSLHQGTWLPHLGPVPLSAALWLLFAGGAWLVLRTEPRKAVPLILLGAVAIQVAALSAPPRGSDDLYRYIWDGRVQAAGIDPYSYNPAAPQLTRLRDPFLWPADAPYCVGPSTPRSTVVRGCTRINRPYDHTIYPPVAEAYFTAVYELSPPGSGSPLPIQDAAALCALATTVLLLAGLRRLGRDPRLAVLWGWCPAVGLEAGNNAHVDVLAAFLTAAALLTLAGAGGRARVIRGAVLLGLAIATKVTPVLAGPAVLRRRPVTLALATVAATVTVYLPHLIAVGAGVLGFLPSYLQGQGFNDGSRFQLLGLILPGQWATLAAVLLLVAVAVAVLCRADPDRPWHGAVVMTGTALAVTTPAYPWYGLLLVVLVAMDGRAEWLALVLAGYLTTSALPYPTFMLPAPVGYGAAVAVVAAVSLIRRHGQPGEPAAQPRAFAVV